MQSIINTIEDGLGLEYCPDCGEDGELELEGPYMDPDYSGRITIAAHCTTCNQDFEHVLQYDYTTKIEQD